MRVGLLEGDIVVQAKEGLEKRERKMIRRSRSRRLDIDGVLLVQVLLV
tara:strand:- start:15 stop:158 length:144 start_codon:yes stop_codon:yes gene_type:complete